MTSDDVTCYLCGFRPVRSFRDFDRLMFWVDCPVCQRYGIGEITAEHIIGELAPGRRAMLAAASRVHAEQGEPLVLVQANIEEIADSVTPPSFDQAMDDVLGCISDRQETFADWVRVDSTEYPVFRLRSRGELDAVLASLKEQGWVKHDGTLSENRYQLTVTGRKRLSELRSRGPLSGRVFVAMWFDDSTRAAWEEGIRPAIIAAGYEPARVDEIHHNERIDDVIIDEIRKSAFVVADFTGQRGGVYYEAGFARGLGIPVIWTCHSDHLKNVHFDTRQYSFVVWDEASDLREKLLERIESTIGRPD